MKRENISFVFPVESHFSVNPNEGGEGMTTKGIVQVNARYPDLIRKLNQKMGEGETYSKAYVDGLIREHYSDASGVRTILRRANIITLTDGGLFIHTRVTVDTAILSYKKIQMEMAVKSRKKKAKKKPEEMSIAMEMTAISVSLQEAAARLGRLAGDVEPLEQVFIQYEKRT